MLKDDILSDLESFRQEYLTQINFDAARIVQDLQQIEKKEAHRVVRFKPQRLSETSFDDIASQIEWRNDSNEKEEEDPVAEIRRFREEYAARFNYDVHLIVENLRKFENTSEFPTAAKKVADKQNNYKRKKKDE